MQQLKFMTFFFNCKLGLSDYYDANKKRMEFIIMLDDVEPVEISDHYDFMEQNHPECKKKFEQLHDFRTSFDDKETDEYNESAIDLLALNNRIIP